MPRHHITSPHRKSREKTRKNQKICAKYYIYNIVYLIYNKIKGESANVGAEK